MTTTRKGWRKSQGAKKYQADILRATGQRINLRQARKDWDVIEKILSVLKPLPPRSAIKVLKATAILTGTRIDIPTYW